MSGYNNGGETDWLPAVEADKYPMARYDHFWNDDYTMFKAVKLLWWDDASYIAYQCGDIDDREDEMQSHEDYRPHCGTEVATAPLPVVEASDDDIPF